MEPWTALVLAGRRGPSDALAEAQGSSHRAFVHVGGTPMLVRVVRALRTAKCIGRIGVSIDAPELLAAEPELDALREAGTLFAHPSLASPSRSVADALAGVAPPPLLVTTADHALLRPEWIDHFVEAACASGADACVGMVSETVLRAAHPESTRTWIPLRGERWSGANLFAFRTPAARRVADFWVRAEAHRKRPWRLAGAFGLGTLLAFALRRLDLDAIFERASVAIGARVHPVALPFAEAAIDVDRPTDQALAERILTAREHA